MRVAGGDDPRQEHQPEPQSDVEQRTLSGDRATERPVGSSEQPREDGDQR